MCRSKEMWTTRLLEIGWEINNFKISEKRQAKGDLKCVNCGYEKKDSLISSIYYRKTKCPYCVKHICFNSDCNKEFYISKEVSHSTLQKNGKGNYRYFCYECVPIDSDEDFQRMRVKYNREKVVSEYGNECAVCGYSRCGKALEFHHLNPEEKEYSPASLIQSVGIDSWDKIKQELDKCILLCSNCHKEVHDGVLKIENIKGDCDE